MSLHAFPSYLLWKRCGKEGRKAKLYLWRVLLSSRWHGRQKEQHYTAEGSRDQHGGLTLRSFPSASRFSSMKINLRLLHCCFRSPRNWLDHKEHVLPPHPTREMNMPMWDDASKRLGAWGSGKHKFLKLKSNLASSCLKSFQWEITEVWTEGP